jgi:hypothetical protein
MCAAAESKNLAFLNHIRDFQQKFVFEVNATVKDENLLLRYANNSSWFMLLLVSYSSSISNKIYLNTPY